MPYRSRAEFGLGNVRLVSLAEAREQALANRKLAPRRRRPPRRQAPHAGHAHLRRGRRHRDRAEAGRLAQPRQASDWLRSLERHVFPGIGSRPVSEVNSADLLAVLTPLWHVKMQTARTLCERIRAALEWTISMEYRADNSCDRVLPVLGPQREVVRHMRALSHRDVAAALKAVRAARSTRAVKLAFEFLVLTAPPCKRQQAIYIQIFNGSFLNAIPILYPTRRIGSNRTSNDGRGPIRIGALLASRRSTSRVRAQSPASTSRR